MTDEAEVVRRRLKRDRELRGYVYTSDNQPTPRNSLAHPLPMSVRYSSDRP